MKVKVNLGVPDEEEEEEDEAETEVEAVEIFSTTGLGDMATRGRGSLAFSIKMSRIHVKETSISEEKH